MSSPSIAVTAAAGKTGFATVRELRARGFAVRALVRRRDARAKALAGLGAEMVLADLDDGDSMLTALKGVHRAYYCPPISPEASTALAAFLHAADAARLEAVTAMTQWLASPDHPAQMTRDMWLVEQRMPTLKGAAVTIVNPGFFADNHLRVTIGMAAQLGLYPNFVGDSRNAPASNDDMARVVAGVLADPGRFAGRRLRITGPALIGVGDITAALSRVLGRRVRALPAPEWLLDKVAAYRGEPRYAMAMSHHYLEDHRQGAFAFGAPRAWWRRSRAAPPRASRQPREPTCPTPTRSGRARPTGASSPSSSSRPYGAATTTPRLSAVSACPGLNIRSTPCRTVPGGRTAPGHQRERSTPRRR